VSRYLACDKLTRNSNNILSGYIKIRTFTHTQVEKSKRFLLHLYQKLSAYRKQHSCKTTVLRLIEDWRAAADRKDCVTVLFTDTSKAFDSLHPALMIQKLKAYGFSDNSVNLMRFFLVSRKKSSKVAKS